MLYNDHSFAEGHRPSISQLERRAGELAAAHQPYLISSRDKTFASRTDADNDLIRRLNENEKILTESYRLLSEAVFARQRIIPAAEWLLDNFFLIETNIRLTRKHFPRGYSRELPILNSGPAKGLPRIHDLAIDFITSIDGILDDETLFRFVQGYQSVSELQLGELWAIPIMLRLALIETIKRISVKVVAVVIESNNAAYWANRIIEMDRLDQKSVILVLADLLRATPDMTGTFIAELHRRLHRSQTTSLFALNWFESHLKNAGIAVEQLISAETKKQSADQVTISNSFGSLRFLSKTDWHLFVESVSVVDAVLRKDPANCYPAMDFATRDQYRHRVAWLAKRSEKSEREVTEAVLELCGSAKQSSHSKELNRQEHVGYYLVDRGQKQLESRFSPRIDIFERVKRTILTAPALSYIGAITFITLLGLGLFFDEVQALPGAVKASLVFLLLIMLSQAAIAIVNWSLTKVLRPKRLPRLDFSKGIPNNCKTAVVIPTLLSSDEGVRELLQAIEVHYLANPDPNLFFALLTDFTDASSEFSERDAKLLELCSEGIRQLNEKYIAKRPATFFLFHRPRLWNAQEGKWMGYERKRGKLSDFNTYLRGKGSEKFSKIEGNVESLKGMQYVITLDTDTQFPRGAAEKLIGTMAHPLNRPVISPIDGRVIDGYAILQPRVASILEGAAKSRFVRLFANEPGIDPYTREVSDVYQDLLGEGTFIGKGVYDLDAMQGALEDRFPENLILSHDLIESCYARSGLVNDVILYESFPTQYSTETKRRHRWIRGDWQIIYWLFPRVPSHKNAYVRNTLSILSRWKIFDNLRRSLVAPATVMLIASTGFLPELRFKTWFAAIVATSLLPNFIASVSKVFEKNKDTTYKSHLKIALSSALHNLAQGGMGLVFLLHDAIVHLSAVFTTVFRLTVTRRKLLQWNSAKETELRAKSDLLSHLTSMGKTSFLAVFLYGAVALLGGRLYSELQVMLGLWFVSPFIAWWISAPIKETRQDLSSGQKYMLRLLARKTWRYFEELVTEEQNWLPVDNLQEFPKEKIAPRTSPTNIGLYLLSSLAAFDFGYLDPQELMIRLQRTLSTLKALPKYKGHLYNWIDTKTLKTLPPSYISTVDSGNLLGSLITLRAGLLQLPEQKVVNPKLRDGLQATVEGLEETFSKGEVPSESRVLLRRLKTCLEEPWDELRAVAEKLSLCRSIMQEFLPSKLPEDAVFWVDALVKQCEGHFHLLQSLTPWAFRAIPHLGVHQKEPDVIALLAKLTSIPTYEELLHPLAILKPVEDFLATSDIDAELRNWFVVLRQDLARAAKECRHIVDTLGALAHECEQLSEMDFTFLFDVKTKLLTIGYNAETNRIDNSYYDLLASEARITSFFGIMTDKIPSDNWFALGRLLTTIHRGPVLLSWSGSAFEYLMPLLILPNYPGTLLDQTCRNMVQRQIDYGKERDVPWGISESGYNAVDSDANYQYRAFGTPGLGFKRGLTEDLVIAPYATLLSLMVKAPEALANAARLTELGMMGKYGFYEAIDYTPSRVANGEEFTILKSYMAHHQGMSFLAMASVMLEHPMQRRLQNDPAFQSTHLLLQEKIPASSPFFPHAIEMAKTAKEAPSVQTQMRVYKSAMTKYPECHFLSNGNFTTMISTSGSGFSRVGDTALNRWREDAVSDLHGVFCFLRDCSSNKTWSTCYLPWTSAECSQYEVVFTESGAEFKRSYEGIDSHMQIIVSPEHNIEIRRVTLRNHGEQPRLIEVTTYAELALAQQLAEEAHPAFNALTFDLEVDQQRAAIIARKRPSTNAGKEHYVFYMLNGYESDAQPVSFETNRSSFIGRGQRITSAKALTGGAHPLSCSLAVSTDPIAALRRNILIEGESEVTFDLVIGYANQRSGLLVLLEEYTNKRLCTRAFDLSWTHAQVFLRQLDVTEEEALLFNSLAGSLIFVDPRYRAPAHVIALNRQKQSGLWGHGISGDLPIVFVKIKDQNNVGLIRQCVKAFAFWQAKGLSVDVVFWNESESGYRQDFHEQIQNIINSRGRTRTEKRFGDIYLMRANTLSESERTLLQAVARVVIENDVDNLAEVIQPNDVISLAKLVGDQIPRHLGKIENGADSLQPLRSLVYSNGYGGFSEDGKEYVIHWSKDKPTPKPWVNVLANPNFGSVVSESGSSYTWHSNCHEFRITPWNNDAVSDLQGEAYYIRDEATGEYWSPAPLPCPAKSHYTVRHGIGYSTFETSYRDIHSHLTVFVAPKSSVKYAVLKLKNLGAKPRHLTVTGYVEWVLDEFVRKSQMHVMTQKHASTATILAQNHYSPLFDAKIGFFTVDGKEQSFTADRLHFMGPHTTLANPLGMAVKSLNSKLSGRGASCAALRSNVELLPGKTEQKIFTLGVADNFEAATEMIHSHRSLAAAMQDLAAVKTQWQDLQDRVQIQTPDASLNFLVNSWLPYQVVSSRLWGRTGFYQSGGAFGFRDQLQDAHGVCSIDPSLLRAQILLCAKRQFAEGDVQHWWHPPEGRGVRTRFSDDFLWLPWAVCHYLDVTEEWSILDQTSPYLQGRRLRAGEESYYDLPTLSHESGDLYDHCVRAIKNSLHLGDHGFPLIGCGDWNDGFSRVGINEKGESVWVGFFLYDILLRFIPVAERRGDVKFAELCRMHADQMQSSLNSKGWNGKWYLRAFYDDGTPLGAEGNSECAIDSLTQSWSVISGAGAKDKALQAMESIYQRLVDKDAGVVKLFAPPFNQSDKDPGYVKAYVAGLRENGGQYTHAAIWVVMAYAMLGNHERVGELLDIINPVKHALTPEAVQEYKVEPYVVAADVYSNPDLLGQGGWTWYTGSASWFYRLVTEYVLGIKIRGNTLILNPCIPPSWPGFQMTFKHRGAVYQIRAKRGEETQAKLRIKLNGDEFFTDRLELAFTSGHHDIDVTM